MPNSHTLTSILDKFDKDIRKFFEQHNPKPQALAKVLDTFVKSCGQITKIYIYIYIFKYIFHDASLAWEIVLFLF